MQNTLCREDERQNLQLISQDVLKEAHLELTQLAQRWPSQAGRPEVQLAMVYNSYVAKSKIVAQIVQCLSHLWLCHPKE